MCVPHKLTFYKILLKIVIERQKFMMISFTENWKPRSSHEIKPLFSGKLHRWKAHFLHFLVLNNSFIPTGSGRKNFYKFCNFFGSRFIGVLIMCLKYFCFYQLQLDPLYQRTIQITGLMNLEKPSKLFLIPIFCNQVYATQIHFHIFWYIFGCII